MSGFRKCLIDGIITVCAQSPLTHPFPETADLKRIDLESLDLERIGVILSVQFGAKDISPRPCADCPRCQRLLEYWSGLVEKFDQAAPFHDGRTDA